MASLTPATIVGVADKLGSLARSKCADIILFDERIEVRRVFLGGRQLPLPRVAAR
jgi:N-acetylglucosamine-6-phosphate deacetylase